MSALGWQFVMSAAPVKLTHTLKSVTPDPQLLRSLPQIFAWIFAWIFASDLCLRSLPQIFASDLCLGSLPGTFASDLCLDLCLDLCQDLCLTSLPGSLPPRLLRSLLDLCYL